jgi:hypothetical protein
MLTIATAFWFRQAFSEVPAITTECRSEYGRIVTHSIGEPISEPFATCVHRRVDLFLKYDYPESKDLAKSFFTLLTALLVASITFSEKIIDFTQASLVSKGLMVACWLSLLGAIAVCGVALAFMAQAAGWAAYQPFQNYSIFKDRAVALFVTAGLAFGVGLATLITAGIISLVRRSSGLPSGPNTPQPALSADAPQAARR